MLDTTRRRVLSDDNDMSHTTACRRLDLIGSCYSSRVSFQPAGRAAQIFKRLLTARNARSKVCCRESILQVPELLDGFAVKARLQA